MKKTFKFFGLFAVAAMTVIGCAKEEEAQIEEIINEEPQEQSVLTHTVTITAGSPETKTVINEGVSSASFKWSSDDATRFHIWENDVEGSSIALETSDGYATIKLTATFATVTDDSYTYTAYLAKNEYDDSGDLYPEVPTAQTCTGTSYDPNADILIAQPVTNEGSVLSKIDMKFGRPCVINKMTLKGLTAGETLSSVEIRADKDLTGYYDIAGKTWTGESSKIVLTTSQTVPATGQVVVYFVTMPVSAATLTVTAITDAHVYDKTFTKTINFVMDQVTTFGVSSLTQYVKRDLLTLPLTTVSGTSYADFSSKSYAGAGHSSAVYAGTIAGGNDAIQLNANSGTSYRGIVSTTSGGSIQKVRVSWESHTANDRSLTIYGKNTAYTTSDLNNSFGTELGSVTCGSSVQTSIASYYEYIMLKAAKAIYLDEIEIFWDDTKSDSGLKWTADGNSGDAVAAADASIETGDDTMPAAALYNPNGISLSEITFTSSDTDVATVGEHTGVLSLIGEGDTDISAVFAGNATYKPITVKYTLSVTDNRTTPVITLDTSDAEYTDVNYASFTGRSATVSPSVTLVYSKSDPSSIIGTFNAETGALTLNGNIGTATVTVSFAGNAEYKAAVSKSYSITVASSSGPADRNAPTSPTITAISPSSFTATWVAPASGGSENGYSWKISTSSDPDDAAIANGTGNVDTGVLTVTVTSGITLTTSTDYYFHVLTRGDGGTNYNDSDYATSSAKHFETYTMTIDGSASGSNNVHWTTANTTLSYGTVGENSVSWTTAITWNSTSFMGGSTTQVQIGKNDKSGTRYSPSSITISTTAFAGKTIVSASLTGFYQGNAATNLTISSGTTDMLSDEALVKSTSTEYSSTSGPVTLSAGQAVSFSLSTGDVSGSVVISGIKVIYTD